MATRATHASIRHEKLIRYSDFRGGAVNGGAALHGVAGAGAGREQLRADRAPATLQAALCPALDGRHQCLAAD